MGFQFVLAALADMVLAFIIAICWSIFFNTPRRVLYVAGLLGGLGHSIRYVMLEGAGSSLVLATLTGCIFVGFMGIIFARKVDTPPVVFTMPACITMIPGLYDYHAMLGFVKIASTEVTSQDPNLIPETAHYLVLTISLLFCLSIGITIGSLLFRKKTAREIKLTIPFIKWRR